MIILFHARCFVNVIYLILETQPWDSLYYSCFSHEETQVQRSEGTCLRSYSGMETDFELTRQVPWPFQGTASGTGLPVPISFFPNVPSP